MFQTLKLSTSTGREANICSSKPHHSQTPRSPRNNLKSTKTTAEASIKSSNSQTGTNKRGQKILRACDRCRLYRVKCGSRPCEQCRSAKAKCVTSKDGAPQRSVLNLRLAEVSGLFGKHGAYTILEEQHIRSPIMVFLPLRKFSMDMCPPVGSQITSLENTLLR